MFLSTAGQGSRPVPQTAEKRRAGALSSVRVKWFAKTPPLVVVVAAVAVLALPAVREVVVDPVQAVRAALGPEELPVLAALLVVVPLALTTSPRVDLMYMQEPRRRPGFFAK
jgi:hypothetical protein